MNTLRTLKLATSDQDVRITQIGAGEFFVESGTLYLKLAGKKPQGIDMRTYELRKFMTTSYVCMAEVQFTDNGITFNVIRNEVTQS